LVGLLEDEKRTHDVACDAVTGSDSSYELHVDLGHTQIGAKGHSEDVPFSIGRHRE
jgi:hypothetical protein